MGRLYMVPYAGNVTNAGGNADLLEAAPASAKPIYFRGFVLSNVTEVGDAAEESLEIDLIRMTATVTGSNGTSVTPVPVRSAVASTAASVATECNGATLATTSGTPTTMEIFAWNERNSPYDFFFPDINFAPEVQNAEFLFMRMITTPADDFTGAFTFWIEED